MIFIQIVLIIGAFITWISSGFVDVPLSRVDYNYAVENVIEEETFLNIVDTGNFMVYTYNRSLERNISETRGVCLNLVVDQTIIQFQFQSPYTCELRKGEMSIGSASAIGNSTFASLLGVENAGLHNWTSSDGDIGLAYCRSGFPEQCVEFSSFQKIVLNASVDNSSFQFGLDFNGEPLVSDKNDPSSSSMQLGGLKDEYSNSIQWLEQTVQTPVLHRFFLQNLQFCDALILGNYSTNWLVEVDTGAVCLSLPGEIYDSFIAWFNTTEVADLDTLPAFKFSMSVENGSDLFIPLANLVVPASSFQSEVGAPPVKIEGVEEDLRLCVLRSGNVVNRFTGNYESNLVPIVFGSLPLRSMYFAADFDAGAVGLANKLSADEVERFNSNSVVGCKAAAICVGDQTFDYSSNTCDDPHCNDYFFMTIDSDSRTCVYNQNTLIGGVILFVFFACLEIISYFVVQYSGYGLETANNIRAPVPSFGQNVAGVGVVSYYLGMFFAIPVDFLVVYVLKWASIPTEAEANNEEDHQLRGVNAADIVHI